MLGSLAHYTQIQMVSDQIIVALIRTGGPLLAILIGLTAAYFRFRREIQDINSTIDGVEESLSSIDNSIKEVDLKEIEKSVLRLNYALDNQIEAGNSVTTELPKSEITATLSLAADGHDDLMEPIEKISLYEYIQRYDLTPAELLEKTQEDTFPGLSFEYDDREAVLKLVTAEAVIMGDLDLGGELKKSEVRESVDDIHGSIEESPYESVEEAVDKISELFEDLQEMEVYEYVPVKADIPEDQITYVVVEFEEKIRSKAVSNKMGQDKELEELEFELFGYECGFKALSPFEIQFSVPSSDYDNIGKWINSCLEKIDEYHIEFENESDKFDQSVEKELNL